MAWLTGWGFRKEITINEPDANLTDLPVYVKIDADADFHEARADGYDIRFTLSDGTTLLKHEREYWTGGDGSAATAHFWVKAPSVLAAGGSKLYIYFGKSDAPDGEDPTNVWDGSFKGVWHLKGSYSGVANEVVDSSGTGNHGQGGSGTSGKCPAQEDAIVYKGQHFDGNGDHLNCGSGVSLDIPTGSVSFLMKVDDNPTTDEALVCKDGSGSNNGDFNTHIDPQVSNKIEFIITNGATNRIIRSNSPVAAATWLTCAFIFGTGGMAMYITGVKQTETNAYTVGIVSEAANLIMGSVREDLWVFDGLLDEVRVATSRRSDAWFKFEYDNMNTPPTLGSEEREEEEKNVMLFGANF